MVDFFDPAHAVDDPDSEGGSRRRLIVVGVTNSPGSCAALHWAMQVSARSDATLLAVTAFQPARAVLSLDGRLYVDISGVEAAARAVQQNLVGNERHATSLPPLIQSVVRQGSTVDVLVHAARDADLLVVGRYGSRVRHLLARGIGPACAKEAPCPVVIVGPDSHGANARAVTIGTRCARGGTRRLGNTLDDTTHGRRDARLGELELIDATLRRYAQPRLVSSAEVADTLLDLRFAIELEATVSTLFKPSDDVQDQLAYEPFTAE